MIADFEQNVKRGAAGDWYGAPGVKRGTPRGMGRWTLAGCQVLVGIDQAATSGWAIWRRGPDGEWGLQTSGTAATAWTRADALAQAGFGVDPDSIAVWFELHVYGSGRTLYGLGDARGRWLETLAHVVGPLRAYPETRVRYVTPAKWRRWHGAPRPKGNKAQRRAALKRWAVERCQVELDAPDGLGDDQAEAALIGWYGTAHLGGADGG